MSRVVAVIPARGGSKGITLKNLREVAGISLVGRAIQAGVRAWNIDSVVVSTDHPGIAEQARRFGAVVVERPEELAGDSATSESAVVHALDSLDADPEVVVFMQCTSPFIDVTALERAVDRVLDDEADSVFSATSDHHFLWTRTPEGVIEPVGHPKYHRPRRQDRPPQFMETGAFYVMRTTGFRRANFRFFDRIDVAEVPAITHTEIDDEFDLELCQLLAPRADAQLRADRAD